MIGFREFVNEEGSQSIKVYELLDKINVKMMDTKMDLPAWISLHSDPKYHKLNFCEVMDKDLKSYEGLTLLRYFCIIANKLDTNIGLWCLKHYTESGVLKKYPEEIIKHANSWMRIFKYDPDAYFGDLDFTNSEAVSFYRKKGFKFLK